MNDDDRYIDVPAYLQIEPSFSAHVNWKTGEKDVRKARVAGVTQTRSNRPRSGTLTVRVLIRVPKACFLPLRPEAVIVIPEDMVLVNPIEVTATDPSGDDDG